MDRNIDLDELVHRHQAKREMSIDGLSSFVELGLNTRVNLEPNSMKGLSIKLTEEQNLTLESVATTIGKSKSKVLQEIVSCYMESAYLSYLKGLHQIDDLNKENIDIDAVEAHLIRTEHKLKGSGNENFHIFMLAKMGFIDRAIDLAAEIQNKQKKGKANE